jgi:hypothetical protein
MKRVILWAVVSALILFGAIAIGAWTYHFQSRTAPGISVYLVDDTGGGGGPGIPQIDGYVSGDAGTDGNYTDTATYRVVANPAGKFFVLAHYHVERSGIASEFDLALPVFEQKPDESKWAQLNPHLKACAYVDGSTMSY